MPTLQQLEDRNKRDLLTLEKKYQRTIQETLRQALSRIRGYMQEIYDKYSVNGELTKTQMTKYSRYTSMEKKVLDILNPAVAQTLKTIDRLTPGQYQESFFHYAWAIDNGSGLRLNWGTLDMEKIIADLDNEFIGIAKTRLRSDSRLWIRAALNNGLTVGKSYQQMARDLKDSIDRTYRGALTIVRTEGQAAVNAAQSAAYTRAIEQGIQGKTIWDATLDGETRPDHGAMDGQAKQDDGYYNGPGGERALYPAWEGLSAGQRINCRCHERFQVDGYSPKLRRTRDQGIIPYMTYADWKAGNGPKVVK